MKVATYNLRFGGKINQRTHWEQVFQIVDPDIFLVQETCYPKLYTADDAWENHRHQVHWERAANMTWGSAIFVKSGFINPILIPEFKWRCLIEFFGALHFANAPYVENFFT